MNQKRQHYEINGILKRKTESVQHVRILSTYICCKKKKIYIYIYKMQHLEGSGTHVLYIGRTVLKG